jgi:hypothetical protein
MACPVRLSKLSHFHPAISNGAGAFGFRTPFVPADPALAGAARRAAFRFAELLDLDPGSKPVVALGAPTFGDAVDDSVLRSD